MLSDSLLQAKITGIPTILCNIIGKTAANMPDSAQPTYISNLETSTPLQYCFGHFDVY